MLQPIFNKQILILPYILRPWVYCVILFCFFNATDFFFFLSFPDPSNPTAWDMSDGKAALPRKHETEQMWKARCAGSSQSQEKERSGWDQGEKQCRECVGCCSVSSAGDVMPTIAPPRLLCAKRHDMRCKALRQAQVRITKPQECSAGSCLLSVSYNFFQLLWNSVNDGKCDFFL